MTEFNEFPLEHPRIHRQQCAVQGAKQRDISFDVSWAQILQEPRDEPKQGGCVQKDAVGKSFASGMDIFGGKVCAF